MKSEEGGKNKNFFSQCCPANNCSWWVLFLGKKTLSFFKTLSFLFLTFYLVSCSNQKKNETNSESQIVKDYYKEQFRNQIHFSPEAKWMNDPNGMVYHKGTYHLFYQYYPEDIVWGPMHWGHAVSKDMVHWEELPIALYPDSLGLIFSGSAVPFSGLTLVNDDAALPAYVMGP